MGKHLDALKIPFYPAHSSNYTAGRNKPIRKVTVHHMAGTPSTLRYLWQNPLTNASSTFGAFPSKLEQYVRIGDTQWTNGNFGSNSECITVEVYGDWRNGRTYPKALAQLKKLMRAVRQDIDGTGINYHQDVALRFTECPAELRKHAKRVWDEVTVELRGPKPAPRPKPSKITYKPINKKVVLLKWAANMWDFNFTDWQKAKAIKGYPKGHAIEAVAVATNSLGGQYYMDAKTYNGGNVLSTNGFNVKDCEPYVPPVPKPKPEPAPVDPTVNVEYEKYEQPIRVEVLKDNTKLWDFNYKTWGEITANEVDTFNKGHGIDIVGQAEHPLGGIYLMTQFSFGNADEDGAPHKTWGVNAVDVKEVGPAVVPEPEPVPIEEIPPEDESPSTAGPGDLLEPEPGENLLSWFEKVWQTSLGKAIVKILSKFKFGG